MAAMRTRRRRRSRLPGAQGQERMRPTPAQALDDQGHRAPRDLRPGQAAAAPSGRSGWRECQQRADSLGQYDRGLGWHAARAVVPHGQELQHSFLAEGQEARGAGGNGQWGGAVPHPSCKMATRTMQGLNPFPWPCFYCLVEQFKGQQFGQNLKSYQKSSTLC